VQTPKIATVRYYGGNRRRIPGGGVVPKLGGYNPPEAEGV